MNNYWPAGTVYGTLLNFRREREHLAAQMTQAPYKAPPQAPVLYIKTANTFSANGQGIAMPAASADLEVGASLGMVIGSISSINNTQKASFNIANWVLMNDLSIPHASFFRPPVKFKCPDGLLGVGSCCVAANELGDPACVRLEVRINGGLRQTVDFAQTVRSARQLLAEVGGFMRLREGDVLMLGLDCLPDGTRPHARAGDVVEISSPTHPALGVLSNTLVKEAA